MSFINILKINTLYISFNKNGDSVLKERNKCYSYYMCVVICSIFSFFIIFNCNIYILIRKMLIEI